MGDCLKNFLEPESIAIVGASRDQSKLGYLILRNLTEFGFSGRVCPVNPEGGEILGLRTYRTISELPGGIDVAVSMVPANRTLQLLDECAAKGINSLLLVPAGFSESDSEGSRLENEVAQRAGSMGIRVMGPNTVGFVNTSNKLVMHSYPLNSLKRGEVAFVAQSNQFCCHVLEFISSSLHYGVSKSIDLGNKCDIDEIEALEYLEDDTDTRVIAIHMETIKDGRRFAETCRRVSKKKPIVVFKTTGRIEDGYKTPISPADDAMMDDVMFGKALEQAGVVRALDMDEFLDLAKALRSPTIPKGVRVAVITFSGAIGAMFADACGEYNLEMVSFSDDSVEKIRPTLHPSSKIVNPIDCWAAAPPPDVTEFYRVAVDTFMSDDNIDMIIVSFVLNKNFWTPDFDRIFKELKYPFEKPMVSWLIGRDELVRNGAAILEDMGLPVFASPERVVRALSGLYKYYIHYRNH